MTRPDFVRGDFRHAKQRLGLEPLRRADEDGARRQVRRDGTDHRPESVRRHRGDDKLGLRERDIDRVRDVHRVGQRDIRQVHRVRASRHHVVDERAIARPEMHVMTDATEVDGKRRSPAARADNGDATHHARAPIRRSVPMRSRARFDRWRKTMMPEAAIAAMTAAGALPTRYAIGGNASVASSEPSEMYFVSATAARKIARTGGTTAGVSTENTPHAVATPLPPLN